MTDIDTDITRGLSSEQARQRLLEEGANSLPTVRKRNLITIAWEVVSEPMFSLLVAAGAIYLALGDTHEALILIASVVIIIAITIYQQRKTERVLEALRELSSPRALVIRDGEKKRIAGHAVVRGDLLVFSEGDRIPADAMVLGCNDLKVDESLLTGESVAVHKSPWTGEKIAFRPGGENLPMVYSGTMVVLGQGIARVTATGIHTELGKIGQSLKTLEISKTPLQRETARLVRAFAILGLSTCVLVILLYHALKGGWLDAVLAGITLAMATIPEEIPVALTVFLALGAWRLSRQNVLTRRIPAVETLGSITVLCVDKTGTLTENRMSIKALYTEEELYRVPASPGLPAEKFHRLIEFGVLASEPDPFDPMEKAFHTLGRQLPPESHCLHPDWKLVHEYSLSAQLLALTHVWQNTHDGNYIVAAKGAPEAIADLCHLDSSATVQLMEQTQSMAKEGLRVIAVAQAGYADSNWPQEQRGFDFKLLGLVGLADPVRAGVPDAIRQCHSAGIHVAMITGDYPVTAVAIGREIGLDVGNVLTGAEIDRMGEAELERAIRKVCIFARILPEQKLRLVKAFKTEREIVAMTGDGVNDAPALRAAHIGIAMGQRGTDVAREASSLVLLDDNFTSIVHAIRQGRRVFDNLRKVIAYILAIHIPTIGMTVLPLLLGMPMVFSPVHIAFLEFVIDPTCSIAFEAEPEERNVMQRPPRNPREPLLKGQFLALSVLQGLCAWLFVFALYAYSLHLGYAEGQSRAMTFATLVVTIIGMIFTNRSLLPTTFAVLFLPNKALWWVIGVAFLILALVLYSPSAQEVFRFSPIGFKELLYCLVTAWLAALACEGLKRLYLGFSKNP